MRRFFLFPVFLTQLAFAPGTCGAVTEESDEAECYDYEDCPVIDCPDGGTVQECDAGACVTDPELICR